MNKRDFKKLKVGDIVYCLRNKRECFGGYDINLWYSQETKVTELFPEEDTCVRTEFSINMRGTLFATEKEALKKAQSYQKRNLDDIGKAMRAMVNNLYTLGNKLKRNQ